MRVGVRMVADVLKEAIVSYYELFGFALLSRSV